MDKIAIVSFKKAHDVDFNVPSLDNSDKNESNIIITANNREVVRIFARKWGFKENQETNLANRANQYKLSSAQITWVTKPYFDAIIQDFAVNPEAVFLNLKENEYPLLLCKYFEKVVERSKNPNVVNCLDISSEEIEKLNKATIEEAKKIIAQDKLLKRSYQEQGHTEESLQGMVTTDGKFVEDDDEENDFDFKLPNSSKETATIPTYGNGFIGGKFPITQGIK